MGSVLLGGLDAQTALYAFAGFVDDRAALAGGVLPELTPVAFKMSGIGIVHLRIDSQLTVVRFVAVAMQAAKRFFDCLLICKGRLKVGGG